MRGSSGKSLKKRYSRKSLKIKSVGGSSRNQRRKMERRKIELRTSEGENSRRKEREERKQKQKPKNPRRFYNQNKRSSIHSITNENPVAMNDGTNDDTNDDTNDAMKVANDLSQAFDMIPINSWDKVPKNLLLNLDDLNVIVNRERIDLDKIFKTLTPIQQINTDYLFTVSDIINAVKTGNYFIHNK
jgi:hypothetical protein